MQPVMYHSRLTFSAILGQLKKVDGVKAMNYMLDHPHHYPMMKNVMSQNNLFTFVVDTEVDSQLTWISPVDEPTYQSAVNDPKSPLFFKSLDKLGLSLCLVFTDKDAKRFKEIKAYDHYILDDVVEDILSLDQNKNEANDNFYRQWVLGHYAISNDEFMGGGDG